MISVRRLVNNKGNKFNLQSLDKYGRALPSLLVQKLKRNNSATVELSGNNHCIDTSGTKLTAKAISRQQLKDINRLIGKPIDICFYSSSGELRIEGGVLVSEATEERLYLGRDELRYCIFRWDNEDSKGIRETIAIIRDEAGNVIYRDGEIPIISQLF
jgi:hypothetical protein